MSNEFGELIACFDMAFSEGLQEALANTTDEHLKDLIERRLLVGYYNAIGPSPTAQAAPIDMVLHCPACGLQHIDEPESKGRALHADESIEDQSLTPLAAWTNPPHRSHLCHGCGYIWRPADVPTNGVKAVKTKGKADSPIASHGQAPQPADKLCYK